MNNIIVFLTKSSFFDEFNFDTLLALISCIAAIVALFIGGTVYSKNVKNKNSLNDSKQFKNYSNDYSQRAGGDIINNGITSSQLESITQSMVDLTKANFSDTLNKTYIMLRDEHERNLQNIINETTKIIEQNKINIVGYTKIDWINMYLENAKITCDPYMQQIWAKVLAKELTQPGSISFKTIDVLKNMSVNEFKILEKLSTIAINGIFVQGEYLDEYGLSWPILQRAKEFGLLSLSSSERTINFNENNEAAQFINKQYFIKFSRKNNTNVKIQCYMLANATNELSDIICSTTSQDVAVLITKDIIKKLNNTNVTIALYRVMEIKHNEVIYDDEDLLKK